MSVPIEAEETKKARIKLKVIFIPKHYVIDEEIFLDTVTNNIGEPIYPPYRADMLLRKEFIIELDPQQGKKRKSKGHGTKHRRIHDKWKTTNIKNQMEIDVVRLIPTDILKQTPEEIISEIDYQLSRARE